MFYNKLFINKKVSIDLAIIEICILFRDFIFRRHFASQLDRLVSGV